MKLIKMTVQDFIDETASNSPAPGGGSVSAFAGSLASALSQMVIRLTTGKKAFKALDTAIQSEVEAKLGELENLSKTLLDLIDEDTEAFNGFMVALKLPKETEEEKNIRNKAMQEATIVAMNIPFKTAQNCEKILKALPIIAEHGNKNAISDVGVATLLASVGLEGAILNVKTNLSGIEDESIKTKTELDCKKLMDSCNEYKESILKIVYSKI